MRRKRLGLLGHDLAELQAVFCKPAEGSRLEPEAATAGIYEGALQEYAALLGS